MMLFLYVNFVKKMTPLSNWHSYVSHISFSFSCQLL